MKIGFDAKRAFHNTTGLGNYSRTLIQGLSTFYPQHQYFLFNPKPSVIQNFFPDSVREIRPAGIMEKSFSSLWRSAWMTSDLQKLGIELYHGLSNEIPAGISRTGIASVVTIHDLIFERFPEQYNRIDVRIYRKKYRHACQVADRIIAISQQTKDDLVNFYKIDEDKIDVCYQSCDPSFATVVDEQKKDQVRQALRLPAEFFLYVGSVIERKNLLAICKALINGKIDQPVVVIGKGKKYKEEVKDFIEKNKLQQQVIFLSEHQLQFLKPVENLVAVYQMAIALVYPSFFEGFGIPVLEALWSRLPVITSNTSCLPEAGGDGAFYIDPNNSEDIAAAMLKVYSDVTLRESMIEKGWQHAQQFSLRSCTDTVMKVYQKLCHGITV